MRRPGLILGLAGCAAAAVLGILYWFDPSTSGFYPSCPFHLLTGLHCPGCGSLRAIHAMLHGDFAAALRFNPLTTLGAPLLLLGIAREAWRMTSGRDPLPFRVPAWSIWMLLVAIVAFGILRNLPVASALAPG